MSCACDFLDNSRKHYDELNYEVFKNMDKIAEERVNKMLEEENGKTEEN